MCGYCLAITAAICRALVDCGDERNPCKYSTWVVGNGWVSKVIPNASSACQGSLATGDNLAHAYRHSQTQPVSATDAFAQRF
jgi:hypothetical protein